jgi:hypothetical protein
MARTERGAAAPQEPDTPAPKKGRKAAKAAKAAKPKKTRWYKQIWQVFQMTRQTEPLIWLWLLLVFAGIVAVSCAVGLFAWRGHAVYMTILGTPLGFLAAMILLMNRAERAAYAKIEEEDGASSAAIGQIRRGWAFEEKPVAFEQRTMSMVFRGVGRPGVVLVADGRSRVRLQKLVEAERRKVARVAPDVPIIVFETGNGEGQVPLRKLSRKIQRQRPKLSRAEVAVVTNRLRAISVNPLPIPKGIDPTRARPDHKAIRGR